MDEKEKFEKLKSTFEGYIKNEITSLKKARADLDAAIKSNDQRKIEFYSKRIDNLMNKIESKKEILAYMRLNNAEDTATRIRIKEQYASLIKEAIPDDEPIVFHGNNNIGIVKRIIASGGLFTPEERGQDFTSFATQIDVGAKNNINTVLEFAEPNASSFLPYGAIFAFYPCEDEYEKVLKTGDSTEVSDGVRSIRFDESRFIGIITTEENVESIRTWMLENGYDESKVFTHQQFLDYCKELFSSKKL